MWRIRNRGMESLYGLMGGVIKGTGIMGNNMERGCM
jgi:hypothetical protein